MIPFNKPYLSGLETDYIKEAVSIGKLSGNGVFTKKCHQYFEDKFHFKKCLLTTSCTDALEMASILLDIKKGDEVIIPSFTFVSTANAFVLRGAIIRFVDSNPKEPNIDVEKIEKLINLNTKVIVVVHYAGVAVNMDSVMALSKKYNLFVVEDAAQAISSYYKGRPLGGIGHLAAFSFHETKNIISGEGGMLVINDEQFIERAEIIWEKGTNRAAFFRGEVDQYGWQDIGSSFLPSEIIAAFLYAQLENLNDIQSTRNELWNLYYKSLSVLEKSKKIKLPFIPKYASNNAHIFYILCDSIAERSNLILFLKIKNIISVFHYQSLYKSSYYLDKYEGEKLIMSDYYADHLLRLPIYYELGKQGVLAVVGAIKDFFSGQTN